MIRWVAPVAHMRRTAARDTESFEVTQIREGDKVAMWYVSANRDEDAFEAADEFRVDRYRAGLGRTTTPVVRTRNPLLHRSPTWPRCSCAVCGKNCCERSSAHRHSKGEPSRLYSNFISGFKTMPVRIEA